MIRSLAVTTDFSRASRVPFPAVRDLALKFKARVHLLHVAQSLQVFTPWQVVVETAADFCRRRKDLQWRLERLVAAEPAFAGVKVEPRVLGVEGVGELGRFLKEESVDLLLIATHGYSSIKHFPMGSFTSKVLQVAPCPLLIYRALDGQDGDGRAPRVTPGLKPARILVPYDFSLPAKQSLDVARSWAEEYQSQVRILTVVEPEPDLGEPPAALVRGEAVEEPRRRLRELVESHWKQIQAEAAVRVGHPALEILREVEDFQPDLIIMASRGLSALDRPSVGSVAERVVHGASCPVLVLRQRS